MFNTTKQYKDISDKDLVGMILKGNEEATLYLIYNRYEKDLRFLSMRYYDSLIYLDELSDELYIKLKGKNGDWAPLKSFQWKCSFRTWLNSVASHLFLEKRDELIGFGNKSVYIDETEENSEKLISSKKIEENQNLVLLLEAINRLSDKDYRFVLLKDLEGYDSKQISVMLAKKRRDEGRLKTRTDKDGNANDIVPTSAYIHMIRHRAILEVSSIVKQIKL